MNIDIAILRDALQRARNDSQLLDGNAFDEAFWDAKDAALDCVLDVLTDTEKALEGLMDIAEIAMPDSYFETDSRVVAAREVLARLVAPPEVSP